MPRISVETIEMTEGHFRQISAFVKGFCGINLHVGKKELVKARLNKRVRKLGLSNMGEYIDYVRQDTSGDELIIMLDALSTNLTSFFRERDHFDCLAQTILPEIAAGSHRNGRRLRIWSAGCSSGEEPYSIAITAREAIADLGAWDARILATDISATMLAVAVKGVYASKRIGTISPGLREKYFGCVATRPDRLYRVDESLRQLVHFSRLNLMDPWPMRGPFNVIFCRNVMIYFDKPTQGKLVERFHDLLAPGGTLFIGHSESLTGIRHDFGYVQPTIYKKR